MQSNDQSTAVLFEAVLKLTGLSPLLGPGTIRRALRDAGADAATATPEDYRRALPRLKARLRGFLEEAEASQRIATISGYLTGLEREGETPRRAV